MARISTPGCTSTVPPFGMTVRPSITTGLDAWSQTTVWPACGSATRPGGGVPIVTASSRSRYPVHVPAFGRK